MILYKLQCDLDHAFEAWFSNSEAFEQQSKCNLIKCPKCGSTIISKAIMAPNIGVKTNRKEHSSSNFNSSGGMAIASGPASTDPQHETFKTKRRIAAAARKLREFVKKNADYVGSEFAIEARKIHYEEAEERGIYGKASNIEIREMLEEGIEVQPLPTLPEDQN